MTTTKKNIETLAGYQGVKEIMGVPVYEPTKIALTVLEKRYFRNEDNGTSGMFRRVANAISLAEEPQLRMEAEEAFYELMRRGLFLPNSPTLMNANRALGQLSACFVLPVEDSMPGIFGAIYNTAIIHQTGGGTGFSFSRLRQKGAKVVKTNGEASGPLSFMTAFDACTETIKQGGARRGANMGILRIDHPDILEFIRFKKDQTKLNNFNISVAIPNSFMQALEKGEKYNLIAPHTGDVEGELDARSVWAEIIEYAWQSGEPGIIFIDEMNAGNPTPHAGEFEATNPCGEQPLLPYESCNLGSINLALMVTEPFDTPMNRINWPLIEEVVKLSARFLDNVIDVNKYPLPQIDEMTKANRKIGLGVMGFADMLQKLGVAYDSDEGVEIGEAVMKFINDKAHEASESLAAERGCFPNYAGSTFDGVRPQRNATVTTIAPTGTISIIAGASSGIEPFFAMAFQRNQVDTIMYETNPKFEAIAKEQGFWSTELLEKISNDGGSVAHCDVPKTVKQSFRVAHDVSPEYHVRMQAAFQKHTDNAVSKTVNFPNAATKEDVETVYRLAYEMKTKGVTIYRDGSRDMQVLSTGKTEQKAVPAPALEERNKKRDRPKALQGFTYQMSTGCGPLYVTINADEDGLFELFTTMGKAGGCAASQCEAIGRMVSLAWRHNIGASEIIKQLQGISCHQPNGFGENQVFSCSDAVAKAIMMHKEKVTGSAEFTIKKVAHHQGACPDCGGVLEHASGCISCPGCGFSKC